MPRSLGIEEMKAIERDEEARTRAVRLWETAAAAEDCYGHCHAVSGYDQKHKAGIEQRSVGQRGTISITIQN